MRPARHRCQLASTSQSDEVAIVESTESAANVCRWIAACPIRISPKRKLHSR